MTCSCQNEIPMKPFIPLIRVISVDHDRTSVAEQRLRHALDACGMREYPVRSVYCHLESGRCGVSPGKVAVEVEGRIIWEGKELTEKLARAFCEGLPNYLEQLKSELGLS